METHFYLQTRIILEIELLTLQEIVFPLLESYGNIIVQIPNSYIPSTSRSSVRFGKNHYPIRIYEEKKMNPFIV